MDLKRIINPWVGQKDYNCYGCCPDNPEGLHLEFFLDGEDVVAFYRPDSLHEGWKGCMHGGVAATLIDEAAGWAVHYFFKTSGMTMLLNVRYFKPVRVPEDQLEIRCHVENKKANAVFLVAEIRNQEGELLVSGKATYSLMDPQRSQELGFKEFVLEE